MGNEFRKEEVRVLEVGIDLDTNEVVVNLPVCETRDGMWHMTFSPEQSVSFARLLIKHAEEVARRRSRGQDYKLDNANPMIMKTKDGWYPIAPVVGIPVAQQAKEQGEANLHIMRIEDRHGNLLWERQVH